MNRYVPLLTLAAVAVLGVGLVLVDVAVTPPAAVPIAAIPVATSAPPAPPPTTVASTPTAAPPVVAEKVYAGRSAGNEVTVAVAVKNGRAVAYICDGRKVEAWLTGTLTGDRLALTGPKGASLDGTVSATAAFGTVAAKGKSWPYSAKGVQAPEGLYEGRADVRGVATRIGWIVLDGKQVGLRSSGDDDLAAPVLDPNATGRVVIDGQPVTVRAGVEVVGS